MPHDTDIKKYKAFIGPNKLLDHLFNPQKKSKKHNIQESSSDIESYTYQSTPPFITGKLRNYQIEGINWLIQMHALNINCILADEMGLGKTLQTITFLGHLKEYCKQKRPHLLIVPKSTLHNWKNEFIRFYPSYKMYIFHCSKTEFNNAKIEIKRGRYDIIITTYEMCISNKILQRNKYSYIIIDEAHRIKNENSKLSQFVRVFSCKHRLLITGTPLQNNVRELWALLNFLVPSLFNDGDKFEAWIQSKNHSKDNEINEKKSEPKKISNRRNNSKEKNSTSDSEEFLDTQESSKNNIKNNIKNSSKNNIKNSINSEISSESDDNKRKKIKNTEEENQITEKKNSAKTSQEKIADKNSQEKNSDNNLRDKNSEKNLDNNSDNKNLTEDKNSNNIYSNDKNSNINDVLDENIQQLRKVILPFFLRREKSDVEKNLRPKKIVNLYPCLSEMQRTWYRNILKKEITGENVLQNKSTLMNIVMQLRKVCNHPYLFDGAEPEPFTTDEHLIFNSGKMVYLDKLLKKFKSENCKVLIFSQMSRMLDIIEDYCLYREYEYRRLDGSTALEERSKGIEEFHNDPNIFVYLLTTRAGGLGINLTAAEIVIIFDSDWNPQMDLQAMDRAHRIGQKKEVKVYRLISENTIEEKIIIRCMQKLKLDERLLKNKKSDKLNKDELMNIITTGVEDLQGEMKVKDQSIEEILKIGEVRTVTLNETINGKALNDETEFDYYKWEGEDYKQRVQKLNQFIGFNEKYMGRSRVRHKRQINLYDFQFHSPELRKLLYKELERDLSYEEMNRKNILMKDIFDWTYKEFEIYLKACESVGKDINDILDYLFEQGHASGIINSRFTKEEVKRFHNVFWKRTHEVSDIEKSLYIIEKTEAKRSKTTNIKKILQRNFYNLKYDVENFKKGDHYRNYSTCDTNRISDRSNERLNGRLNEKNYDKITDTLNDRISMICDEGMSVDTNSSKPDKNIFIDNIACLNENNSILDDILNDESLFLYCCRHIRLNYTQNTRSKYYNDKIDKLICLLSYVYHDNENITEITEKLQSVKWLKFDYYIRTRDENEIGKRLRVIGDLLLKGDVNETKVEERKQSVDQ